MDIRRRSAFNQIVSEIVLDGKGFAGMEMKTGNAALARSQEANYRAAIEGMLGALVKMLSVLDLRALEILREIFISSDQFNKRIIR